LEKVAHRYRFEILPGTTNETHLSGRLVLQSIDLKHNDIIRIGSQKAGLMVTLTYLSQSDQAAEKPLSILFGTRSKLQIGRDAENDVVLESPMVSRFHAQIERVGQRYRIKDLRSSNGVHVNDQRIEGEVWLRPGDVVRIGPYRFLVGQDQLAQYDETGGLGVDAYGLNKWVRKDLNILQDISLTFQPRELVVVVGQSGEARRP